MDPCALGMGHGDKCDFEIGGGIVEAPTSWPYPDAVDDGAPAMRALALLYRHRDCFGLELGQHTN